MGDLSINENEPGNLSGVFCYFDDVALAWTRIKLGVYVITDQEMNRYVHDFV